MRAAALDQDRVLELIGPVIDEPLFPCLGARSVIHREGATTGVFGELGTADAAHSLVEQLAAFADATEGRTGFVSFIAAFEGPKIVDEEQFETLLWDQLQLIHDVDEAPWDESVSDDPANEHFAFSAAGSAYYVIGLHPQASRLARRVPMPVLVFNPHAQFVELRQQGRFERMRDAIRIRDERLQGSRNPMTADHGTASEARQYSGRAVGPGWVAPLRARTAAVG